MTTKSELLRYDWSGVQLADHGLPPEALRDHASALKAARAEVIETDLALYAGSSPIPVEKKPLDAGFIEMPARMLAAYESQREESELGRILTTAKRLRETVDRVVVLGIGGSYMGARALMEACNHPYHNELSRAERGSVPRLYFEGNNVDNDAAQGLLDLLPTDGVGVVDKDWAVIVISKSGGTLETASALRIFLAQLRRLCGGSAEDLAQRVVPVTGSSGKLHDLATALGCPDIFQVPDGVGGRFSILSPVGLLPAAVLGLDVVELLRGAIEMTDHFRAAPVGNNRVLDYVGVCHLMETERQANLRVLSVWSKSLEAIGLWYDQLLAESIGKDEKGATPLTVVNTRDLHSRAQQHQEGTRDKLFTNLILDSWRRDPLAIGHSDLNQDGLNQIADRTLPQIMQAALDGTNRSYQEDGRPTADIVLASNRERQLGQLFQMLMLATVTEGRLLGINPYGQPGVEGYKKFMKQNLGLA
ncbi:MAG: glucose-6-phosphate isomerase [Planctomycetota bacterium]